MSNIWGSSLNDFYLAYEADPALKFDVLPDSGCILDEFELTNSSFSVYKISVLD